MTTIRTMREKDWPAVADIFGQGIATGDATFETTVPSWVEFDASRHPLLRLVATTSSGDVVGWAAASPVSTRPVYRGVVEHSVYVADAARGRGVGRELLNALVELAELCGVWTLRSGIFPENAASLAVHGQCGFREVGRHRRLGFGNGRWRDVVLVERRSLGVGTARPFLRTATPRMSDTAASSEVAHLLRDNGLPSEGLDAAWLTLLADSEVTSGPVVGCAALERHEQAYLLRSVAVSPDARDQGLGRRLVTRALDIADLSQGRRAEVALLTMTPSAAAFFTAVGFERIERAQLPDALAASPQLRGACPDSAQAWRRR